MQGKCTICSYFQISHYFSRVTVVKAVLVEVVAIEVGAVFSLATIAVMTEI